MKDFDSARLTLCYNSLLSHFGPQRWWPAKTAFEVAVGAILTQNTSWRNVERAIVNLRRAKCLRFDRMSAMSARDLARLIKPAGYYNMKARRLKSFLDFLGQEFGGSMARMAKLDGRELRQRLLSVHGIGEETADAILLYALDKSFFVVDAYTRRLALRHGWVSARVRYDELQAFFMARLEADVALFNEYHALIVAVGKNYCKRSSPMCQECPLSADLIAYHETISRD